MNPGMISSSEEKRCGPYCVRSPHIHQDKPLGIFGFDTENTMLLRSFMGFQGCLHQFPSAPWTKKHIPIYNRRFIFCSCMVFLILSHRFSYAPNSGKEKRKSFLVRREGFEFCFKNCLSPISVQADDILP